MSLGRKETPAGEHREDAVPSVAAPPQEGSTSALASPASGVEMEGTVLTGDDDVPETNAPVVVRSGLGMGTGPGSGLGEAEGASGSPSRAPGSQHSAAELAPGLRVQQYELIRELGRGGMGTVYLARDTRLGRKVAIKFLRGRSPRFIQRFLVEARATARCTHENIIVIHEVSEHEGRPFMVLEYLDGEPLNQRLQGRPLPTAQAVEIIIPVVRALARAHSFNIVHRDLKPENIHVTASGTVKVLDFGIVKLFEPEKKVNVAATLPPIGDLRSLGTNRGQTRDGAMAGTVTYMAPEQWGTSSVDHRADLWAVGLILYEMVSGTNPLAQLNPQQLMANAIRLGEPMPAVGQAVPDLPGDLERIIDRCLDKRADQRYQTASELLEALDALRPGRGRGALGEDQNPFPGLTPFQEADADRFFGRSREVRRAVTRVREQPLVGLVGPSGVGKSSLVRAGIVPALKRSGEGWEVFVTRPGRDPLGGLAAVLQPLTRGTGVDLQQDVDQHRMLREQLLTAPGTLGTLLRSRARQKQNRVLLFVDQFEELFTLVPDPAEQRAYLACLAGTADDVAAPLRVVLSMRSDFLDRLADHRTFLDELARGLIFLQPPNRAGLREALAQPAEMAGFAWESDALLDRMLAELDDTPGALPLLQFAAAKLWEARDRQHRLLTTASYETMGGVAGALASHADEVIGDLSQADRTTVRGLLERLVTPEETRAIVDVAELEETLGEPPATVRRLIDHLVQHRLLVVQGRSETTGPAVELVHESLITRWPTLQRWLDESQEDAAFLTHLRATAKQWESRGRPAGLLWRGDTMEDARRWHRRWRRPLPALEKAYLLATFALADRAARIRRRVVAGVIAFLVLLVAGAAVALLWITHAEREATRQRDLAQRETRRARAAEQRVKHQIETIRAKEREKRVAEQAASKATVRAETGERKLKTAEKQLTMSYAQLQEALLKAQAEKTRAEAASKRALEAAAKAREATAKVRLLADAERKSREKIERLLKAEQARVRQLLKQRKKIATELR